MSIFDSKGPGEHFDRNHIMSSHRPIRYLGILEEMHRSTGVTGFKLREVIPAPDEVTLDDNVVDLPVHPHPSDQPELETRVASA